MSQVSQQLKYLDLTTQWDQVEPPHDMDEENTARFRLGSKRPAHEICEPLGNHFPLLTRTPLSHILMTSLDLKELLKQTQEKNTRENLQAFQMQNLELMGQEIVKFGNQKKGQTYLQAYQGKGYVKWCVDNSDNPKYTTEMKKFLVFLRRMLEAEAQGQDLSHMTAATESGSRPKMPQNSTKKTKEKISSRPEKGSMNTELPDSESSDWSQLEPSKTEMMEGEMMNLHSQVSQMETMLADIMTFIRSQSGPKPS